ncbi:LysR family transcriptional regulator [Citromicrobium bathyomarinum]|uniref:LysR family transcriptional regulator n=1 Tax=Citromicrobium bathyomarinum TaxID=72174 RepID=UPI003159B58D
MQISKNDLGDFSYFIAIARHRSFRKASLEIGVTPSALSHAMTALETRRDVRLLNRTTRSVTLTAAGEDLLAAIEGPMQAIGEASQSLDRLRNNPAGRIRINVLGDAVPLLLVPVIPTFIERYPEIELDISVDNRLLDITAKGYDAGIRYGGTVPEDMVARSLSDDIPWVAAAAPDYLDRFGRPSHPADLKHHRCIAIRLGNDQIYKWEFERAGEEVAIETPRPMIVDESSAGIGLARAGAGITYGAEPVLREYVRRGELELVLEDWASMGEGFHAYYTSRRQVPTALRLLIDLIRELKPLRAG